jgi:hypothetical protein
MHAGFTYTQQSEPSLHGNGMVLGDRNGIRYPSQGNGQSLTSSSPHKVIGNSMGSHHHISSSSESMTSSSSPSKVIGNGTGSPARNIEDAKFHAYVQRKLSVNQAYLQNLKSIKSTFLDSENVKASTGAAEHSEHTSKHASPVMPFCEQSLGTQVLLDKLRSDGVSGANATVVDRKKNSLEDILTELKKREQENSRSDAASGSNATVVDRNKRSLEEIRTRLKDASPLAILQGDTPLSGSVPDENSNPLLNFIEGTLQEDAAALRSKSSPETSLNPVFVSTKQRSQRSANTSITAHAGGAQPLDFTKKTSKEMMPTDTQAPANNTRYPNRSKASVNTDSEIITGLSTERAAPLLVDLENLLKLSQAVAAAASEAECMGDLSNARLVRPISSDVYDASPVRPQLRMSQSEICDGIPTDIGAPADKLLPAKKIDLSASPQNSINSGAYTAEWVEKCLPLVDAAFLKELDAAAQNAKALQQLNSVLAELQACQMENQVLRAETYMLLTKHPCC